MNNPNSGKVIVTMAFVSVLIIMFLTTFIVKQNAKKEEALGPQKECCLCTEEKMRAKDSLRADSIIHRNLDGSFEIIPGYMHTRKNGSVHIYQADSSDAVDDAFYGN